MFLEQILRASRGFLCLMLTFIRSINTISVLKRNITVVITFLLRLQTNIFFSSNYPIKEYHNMILDLFNRACLTHGLLHIDKVL